MNTHNNDDVQGGKTAVQMQKLVQEHSDCIQFAEEIMRIAEHGADDEIVESIKKVIDYNNDELESHLQHEEQTILRTLIQNHPEHAQLCVKIGKEHGYIRTLIESMSFETARNNLAEFGRILKAHTLLEDKELFPLVKNLFTENEMAEIERFTPFQRHDVAVIQSQEKTKSDSHNDLKEWLSVVEQYFNQSGKHGGSIILFPHFNPDLSKIMAKHLGLKLFDYQKEVMAAFGKDADSLSLNHLDTVLFEQAEKIGIVAHNVEALLCVKSENERRAWLRLFLDAKWPNPVFVPITIFQPDVPVEHQKVCDLELYKMPRQAVTSLSDSYNRIKYYVEERQ